VLFLLCKRAVEATVRLAGLALIFTDMGPRNLSDHEYLPHARKLFVSEWFTFLDFNDQKVADKLGVARETVFRWRQQSHRLNPQKLDLIASALGIEPQDFWHDPTQPSWDYLLRKLSQSRRAVVIKLLKDHLDPKPRHPNKD
jgi:hypothetical protein